MIFTKAWSSLGISLCEIAVWILWNGFPIERYMISYYGNKSGNRFPDSFHKKEGFLINCEVVSIWYCWCSILIIFLVWWNQNQCRSFCSMIKIIFSKFNKRVIGKNVSCARRQLECGNKERQDAVLSEWSRWHVRQQYISTAESFFRHLLPTFISGTAIFGCVSPSVSHCRLTAVLTSNPSFTNISLKLLQRKFCLKEKNIWLNAIINPHYYSFPFVCSFVLNIHSCLFLAFINDCS